MRDWFRFIYEWKLLFFNVFDQNIYKMQVLEDYVGFSNV